MKKIKLFRFIVSGGIATGVNLVLIFILTEYVHLWYLLSATLAFFSAFLISFFLQKFWTFNDPSKDKIRRQAFLFLATIIIGVGVNDLVVYSLVEYVNVHYLVAQIIGAAFIACANFIIYQRFIFNCA